MVSLEGGVSSNFYNSLVSLVLSVRTWRKCISFTRNKNPNDLKREAKISGFVNITFKHKFYGSNNPFCFGSMFLHNLKWQIGFCPLLRQTWNIEKDTYWLSISPKFWCTLKIIMHPWWIYKRIYLSSKKKKSSLPFSLSMEWHLKEQQGNKLFIEVHFFKLSKTHVSSSKTLTMIRR